MALACLAAPLACVLPGTAAAPATPGGTAGAALDSAAVHRRLQSALDSLRNAAGFPGATLAVALPNGQLVAVATGESDTVRQLPMRPEDRLLQGSVGKTYVAAVAMQLVAEGRLALDAPISRYLGDLPWFGRIPNATTITVRQLMNHTSGLVRYEFKPEVGEALRADPHRAWTPEERLSYVLDSEPPFEAGEGWEYSDTNYIVLGMIIERLTSLPYYDALRARILEPFDLTNTIPSDRRDLPGVVVGYAGPRNSLGGFNATMGSDGLMVLNPQFEWTGGGIASTTADLARWGKLLYEGKTFDPTLLPQMLDGVPARLGGNARYGLGVIIRDTPVGAAYGHSGFYPGYATEMLYLPERGVAAAIQVNTSDPYPRGLVPFLLEVLQGLPGTPGRR